MRADFKDIVIVVILWVALSAAGYGVMLGFTPFPVAAAEEAHLVDEAFTILTVLAVPVFTFVIAVLIYSAFRYRVNSLPAEDGPPVRGHRPLIFAWFAATAGLTALVIVHPGVTGLQGLRGMDSEPADLVVQVEAQRFAWTATYPEYGVFSRRELVLPVDEHVRFNITATDVLHSFWIPAFRVKIDAVPGQVTSTSATPTMLGGFGTDANFRLQCAELCGFGHNAMRMPVRVLERGEFEAWIAEQQPVRQ